MSIVQLLFFKVFKFERLELVLTGRGKSATTIPAPRFCDLLDFLIFKRLSISNANAASILSVRNGLQSLGFAKKSKLLRYKGDYVQFTRLTLRVAMTVFRRILLQ